MISSFSKMKKIVIIGGGFTGTQCAMKFDKDNDFEVTLIDSKPYFEYTPGILRTIIEPEHIKKIQALHKAYLPNSKVYDDEVIEITKKEVITKKKKNFSFDYLIISSGSSYAVPIKEAGLIPATRAKELVMYHEKLQNAKSVLIIGGGLVGIELAAEICTHYKDKKIILCHSHDKLIERNNVKSQKYVEKFLKRKGVRIIFGERIKSTHGEKGKGKHFVTDKGTKIESDMSFISVGTRPNFEFMKKKFKSLLTERNQIEVNEYLQLKSHRNIFVGGDIVGIKEEKVAQTAEKHAELIVRNIHSLENKKNLEKYGSMKRPMVISLGKYNGIFENGNFVFFGIIPAFLKWFVEKKTMWKYR